ncbi:HlyD family secretion protein [bacterium]|jgi:HlyD family secretion protein|nr:HlyD family secretion protein [bacterium]MDC0288081.1 HlyD family secretion protein [Rubripirellula sp.]
MRSLAVKFSLLSIFLVASLATPVTARAEDEPDSASDSGPKATQLKGVIEAVVAEEIEADTEQITSYTIERLVPHGSTVKAGQNVVWFDSEPINEKMKAADIEMRLATITMEEDEFNHKQFLASQKLKRSAVERTWRAAQQGYTNFVKVDRERTIKTQENMLKGSLASLENTKEELEQLQQMYDADELTEESEEIVLKRAKRAVESAEFRHQSTIIAVDRAIKQGLPRTIAEQEATFTTAEHAHAKAVRDLGVESTRAQIEITKKRDAYKKAQTKLSELKAERKKVAIASKISGIVVHGKLTRGKLSDKPSLLTKGTTVTGSQVIATVLAPGKLQVRLDLAQSNLSVVTPGAKCTVTVPGVEGFKASGTVKSVSAIPYAGSRYDCVVSFSAGKNKLTPTMACDVSFAAKEAKTEGKKK